MLLVVHSSLFSCLFHNVSFINKKLKEIVHRIIISALLLFILHILWYPFSKKQDIMCSCVCSQFEWYHPIKSLSHQSCGWVGK